MKCPECNLNLVPIERRVGFTFTAFVGLLAFLCGLAALLFSPMIGMILIVIGVFLDRFGRDKKLFMVCPSCKHEATDKSSFAYQLGRMFGGASK